MENTFERHLVDEAGMEYRSIDKEGNISKYRLYKGHKYSPLHFSANVPERLKAIENMECRDDDIVLSVFPKSGTHWLTNIVSMVARGNTEYVGTPPIIDFIDLTSLTHMESPRIIATHLPFECFPRGFKEGKSKIITISRNPKDVAVSFYTFCTKLYREAAIYEGNWNGFFNIFINREIVFDSWFDYVKMWGPAMKRYKEKEILFLNYESMKKDLYSSIIKVVKFLGVDRSEAFCKDVETKCTFSLMKECTEEGMKKSSKEWLHTAKGGILPIYRKGEVGDWKNWFTVAQSELFDSVYDKELKGHDVANVYTPENLITQSE